MRTIIQLRSSAYREVTEGLSARGRRLAYLLVAFLALTLWFGVLQLAPVASASTPTVQEFAICTLSGGQYDPAISGNTVVWMDGRSGTWHIYGYDLSSETEFPVSSREGDEYHFFINGLPVAQDNAAISGSTVVWSDLTSLGTGPNLFGYDLASATEFPIASKAGASAISDTTVVWQDGRDAGAYQIYGYDLASKSEFPICTRPEQKDNPAVAGNLVAWMDYRNGDWDIYAYDVSSKTEFPVCTAPGNQASPTVLGSTVLWSDDRNGTWDIYARDLSSGTEFPVSTAAGDQRFPAPSESFVVWQDSRNGNWDIYGYDLSSKTEFPVCTAAGYQLYPAISGSTVVWHDWRGADSDIYGARLATYARSGLLAPVAADGSSIFKAGRGCVPLKFQVFDAGNQPVGNLLPTLSVVKVSSGISGDEYDATSTAAPSTGTAFRYDPAAGQYVYNLATKAMTVGTYRVFVDLGIAGSLEGQFSLR